MPSQMVMKKSMLSSAKSNGNTKLPRFKQHSVDCNLSVDFACLFEFDQKSVLMPLEKR